MTTDIPSRDEVAFHQNRIAQMLANIVILVILFTISRFVRGLWSQSAGDLIYSLLVFYVLTYLATWTVDLFSWIRNPDTSFMMNMIVRAVASFGIVTGLRIATAPIVTQAMKHMT